MNRSLGAVLLRAWREERKITQQEMANRIGCDFVIVSTWERGARRPGLRRALDIARVTEGAVPCDSWFTAAPQPEDADGDGAGGDDEEGGSKTATAGA
jgi:transcriptional regulator with XRE-family HTH domain